MLSWLFVASFLTTNKFMNANRASIDCPHCSYSMWMIIINTLIVTVSDEISKGYATLDNRTKSVFIDSLSFIN